MKKIPLFFLSVLTVLVISCIPETPHNATNETSFKAPELFPEPPRHEGQTDVIELRCPPIDTVRIAFIGLGMRGAGAIHRYTFLEGVKIVALCDVVPENVEKCQQKLLEKGWPEADTYTGAEDWKIIPEPKTGKSSAKEMILT